MTPSHHLSAIFACLTKEVIAVLQCLGFFWTENFSMPALAFQFHHNKSQEEKEEHSLESCHSVLITWYWGVLLNSLEQECWISIVQLLH